MQSPLMMPREVAERLGVNPKTVSRWARLGWIKTIRTPGGHRRYYREEIERMVADGEHAQLPGVKSDWATSIPQT